MAALGASARCVARVNKPDGDSRIRCLVREKAVELVERPARQPVASVSASSPDPVTNAAQVFNGDTSTGAFGGLDDRFRDDVVLMAAEPGLFAGYPPKFLLGPLAPFPLKALALEVVLAAHPLDDFAAMADRAVTGGSDLGDPKVHADELSRVDRLERFPRELDIRKNRPSRFTS
jgi:hypothetical protein